MDREAVMDPAVIKGLFDNGVRAGAAPRGGRGAADGDLTSRQRS